MEKSPDISKLVSLKMHGFEFFRTFPFEKDKGFKIVLPHRKPNAQIWLGSVISIKGDNVRQLERAILTIDYFS